MKTISVISSVCACLGLSALASADVQPAPHFSTGMVLQQSTEAYLWGYARPGERVIVTGSWKLVENGADIGEATGEAMTNNSGWWGVQVRTPAAKDAPSPVTITVKGDNTVTISDVLIGEVWLASGQSNMEWSIAASAEPERALAEADKIGAGGGKVRFFQVENAFSLGVRAEVGGKWVASSAATASGFSAVAFNFARDLSEKLGVPVGVVQADWGGTPVEAWMSEEGLTPFKQYEGKLRQQAILRDPTTRVSLTGDMEANWWNGLDRLQGAAPGGWMKPDFDDSTWPEVQMPASFAGDLAQFDGVVYERRTVELPASAAGKEGVLELGPVDDRDEAWVNGILVGGTRADNQWSVARKYTIPEGVLKAGKNVVAVRVLDTGGLGGFGGKADQMKLSWVGGAGGEKPVSLAGGWKQRAGAAKADWPEMGQAPNIGPGSPTALFNAMIAPLSPLSIAGVIWYQGESNVGDADNYEALFKAMIADWRRWFMRSDLPFGFVQIAPFEYTRYASVANRTRTPDLVARLREAQSEASAIQRTGMVVTLDVGDPADIHPRNKWAVGQRLAGWAMGSVYGGTHVQGQSPKFSSASFEGGSAVVTIDRCGNGLVSGWGEKPVEVITGFVLAGEDKRFVAATGRIDGTRIIVTAPGVTNAVAVRYAWDQAPQATVWNKNGLPLGPFRSDDWAWGAYTTAMSDVKGFRTKDAGFVDLFNGKDLAGWANINTAPSTWSVKPASDGSIDEPVIACTGHPTGLLRTDKMYENFILEVEWRHLESGGNAGLFVWSDALTARGQPFTRAVEVQVMDGAEGEWYTSDGDIFPIHGATMTPENPRGNGNRAFPTERRMRTAPEWNHYRLECNNGDISLAVNGKVVTKGKAASPRVGYICLESEGSPVEFRGIRVKELPSSGNVATPSAKPAEGFVPLFTGVDFAGWKHTDAHKGHWLVDDWTITFDGVGPENGDLWSEKSYKDFVLVCDWRWTAAGAKTQRPIILPTGLYKKGLDGKDEMVEVLDAGDSGIYLRGSSKSQVNAWCWPIGSGEVYGYRTDDAMPPEIKAGVTPKEVADAPIGQWNRFVITMKGDLLTVELNAKTVLKDAKLPGVAAEGPIALQAHGSPIQWGNIYIKELK